MVEIITKSRLVLLQRTAFHAVFARASMLRHPRISLLIRRLASTMTSPTPVEDFIRTKVSLCFSWSLIIGMASSCPPLPQAHSEFIVAAKFFSPPELPHDPQRQRPTCPPCRHGRQQLPRNPLCGRDHLGRVQVEDAGCTAPHGLRAVKGGDGARRRHTRAESADKDTGGGGDGKGEGW